MAETGSTNADLLAEVERGGGVDRTVLITDHQTAGRGRLDRRWDAPPGSNLLMSILFTDPPAVPAVLTQMVGIAAVEAVASLLAERSATSSRASSPDEAAGRDRVPGLKWPNDVLLGERKLAGVLAQRASTGAVVVGCGLNVGWAPEGAASLHADLGVDVEPRRVADGMLRAIDAMSDSDVSSRYRRNLTTIGRRVRVELPGDRLLVGTAVDVDAGGRLVVEEDAGDGGVRHVLDAGDVVHLRPA